jgi:hypothetical protein
MKADFEEERLGRGGIGGEVGDVGVAGTSKVESWFRSGQGTCSGNMGGGDKSSCSFDHIVKFA